MESSRLIRIDATALLSMFMQLYIDLGLRNCPVSQVCRKQIFVKCVLQILSTKRHQIWWKFC